MLVNAIIHHPLKVPFTITEIVEHQNQDGMSFVKKPIIKKDVITIKMKGLIKVALPSSLRHRAIQFYHDQLGHPGNNKVCKMISQHYFWPNMKTDIISYISTCDICQRVKSSPALGELQSMPVPDKPLQLVSMDTIVMGSAASGTAAKYIQVVIDHCSRYIWTLATKSNTADAAKNSTLKNYHKSWSNRINNNR